MFKFFKPKVKEENTKLEIAKDLWLNYKNRYVCYDIFYKDPILNAPNVFKFPYKFDRNMQQEAIKKDKNKIVEKLILDESRGLLTNKMTAYWLGGDKGKGLIIQEPISVKFYEINKAEYKKLQKQKI